MANMINKIKKTQEKLKEKHEEKVEAKVEALQNEGDVIIEDLFTKLEPYRKVKDISVEGYETAREHYDTTKEKFDEAENNLRQLESKIDTFEKKVIALTGGAITADALKEFREDSNTISIWFGKYEGFLQYTAASAVVFNEKVDKVVKQ